MAGCSRRYRRAPSQASVVRKLPLVVDGRSLVRGVAIDGRLRNEDLVETRRDRQMIYYTCKSDAVRKLLGTLEGIFEDA